MKVVRLRRGYRINLTDSDMDLLGALVSEGIGGCIEGIDDLAQNGWTPAMVAAWTRRTKTHGQFLNIDEDRRDPR